MTNTPPEPPLIEYRDATVVRNGRTVLDSVTLSIGVGEHVAILGPNGSGKSSLIKTITRECYPLQKDRNPCLRIFGQESWNVFELRALLGIVSNDLMEACTRPYSAREMILSGFFSSVGVWPHQHITAEMEQKTRQVLELLEIAHLSERDVDELSSGEARRVLIGRALVHDPKALVFDEPTNSLDLHATYGLRNILRKIAQAGTGIILVTHHLPDLIPEIDRVIFLRQGRVVADGVKEALLNSDSLARLFAIPAELVERDGYYHLL